MMKKSFKYLIASLLCITLFACSKDDDPQYPRANIVGQWFEDLSDGTQTYYRIMGFYENGDFYSREVMVGITENLNSIAHGSYCYNGNIEVIEEDDYDARHYFQSYRINNSDYYTLEITSENYHTSYRLHRIIDSYDMTPGEMRTFNIDDASFQPFNYVSCDEHIATVDGNGNIQAIKRGTTYIRALSAAGETVIEVNVIDGDNLIDNFPKYLGGSLEKILSDYGTNSSPLQLENGMSVEVYNVDDEYVKEIGFFYYVSRHIYNIQLTLHNRSNIQDIIDFFDRKYERVSTSEDAVIYQGMEGGTYFMAMVNKQTWSVIYQWSPDPLEQWDAMVTASVDDVIRWHDYNFSLIVEGLYRATVNDGVVNNCVIYYDENTRDIKMLSLTLNSQIKESIVKAWLKERYGTYLGTNNVLYYISGNNLTRSEYYVQITKTNAGLVQVNYLK